MLGRNVKPESNFYGVPTRKNIPPKDNLPISFQSSRSVLSNSSRPHRLQHARLPCPSPTPRAYSNSCRQSPLGPCRCCQVVCCTQQGHMCSDENEALGAVCCGGPRNHLSSARTSRHCNRGKKAQELHTIVLKKYDLTKNMS